MSTIIYTLITDRTTADVARVHELAVKGYAGMTAAELAEWLAGMKGAYNDVDLNRVGTALNYLRQGYHVAGEDRKEVKTWMLEPSRSSAPSSARPR